MVRLKLDLETTGYSSIVERMTGARVKDCFRDDTDETIYFVVSFGHLGKALGKGGGNIKRIQERLGKRIKIIEYRNTVVGFVKNVIYPLKVESIEQKDGVIIIRDNNKKTKSLLIGRQGKNLKLLNRAVKRFFNITEVKIDK
tara:strand:+ start:59 stop:484 length:426 start_codon:yes stop_codon:yes gene_type:complete